MFISLQELRISLDKFGVVSELNNFMSRKDIHDLIKCAF